MTQEFKKIFETAIKAKAQAIRSVLVTVVDVDGSAYRGPGVRMLVLENHKSLGAVSGGCVESDIIKEAQFVFKSGQARMMSYDGRYRLGCEGTLYILLEPFLVDEDKELIDLLNQSFKQRQAFTLESSFVKDIGVHPGMGTQIIFEDTKALHFNHITSKDETLNYGHFVQKMEACPLLYIFGSEHDATELCQIASLSGWEVNIVSSADQSCSIQQFPGAREISCLHSSQYEQLKMDAQTSVVVMSHNFANDLAFLLGIRKLKPFYIGLLGSAKRKEKLLNDFLEYAGDLDENFMGLIHAPAGLNIGAVTAQEIALSILSEILSVHRQQEPMKLSDKKQAIHA